MEFIRNILTWNEILTISILGWLIAQLIKTTISSILAGKLQRAGGRESGVPGYAA